jgi:threonine dehydratase
MQAEEEIVKPRHDDHGDGRTPALVVGLADVQDAASRIVDFSHRTPILDSRLLSAVGGSDIRFKAELFQRGGSHKTRGSFNFFLSYRERHGEFPPGVVTASSGNHGQAVAMAASHFGVPAIVVMPADANPMKVTAALGYGAKVVQDDVDAGNREDVADHLAEEEGYVRNRADDPECVAGFGSLGIEIVEQLDRFDAILLPVGIGALLAGVAVAIKALRPGISVIGVEPITGGDGRASLRAGRIVTLPSAPDTIADGARTTSLSERVFETIYELVDDIVVVSEDELLKATWLLWTRLKILAEPTGAMSFAGLLAGRLPGSHHVCVISGGNADVEDLGRRFADASLGTVVDHLGRGITPGAGVRNT